MTLVNSANSFGISYFPRTLERAARAMCCSPFRYKLFTTLQNQSVGLKAIAASSGFEAGYTKTILLEVAAEHALVWLIQVGVLRREVDGQGITDSFRLTPLGHLLLDQWQTLEQFPQPSWHQRLYNALSQRLTLFH